MTNSSLHPTRCALELRIRGEGEDAKTALSDLCAACYEPVFEIMPIDAGNLNRTGHLNA